jgi:hypothetical protein
MTLEQLAYLSQIVAAVGILGSLVFLALEIRRNTNESRRQSTEDATSHRNGFVRLIATDSELAALVGHGLTGGGLSANQWFRFNMFFYAIFVEFELTRRQYESGDMDRDLWNAWLEAYRWWLQFPGVRKWWSTKPAGYTTVFREFVDVEIAGQPPASESLLAEVRKIGANAEGPVAASG